MAHDVQNPNAKLRDELHADLCDFVQTYENKALAAGDTALATYTRKSHQPRLDALREGREVTNICRFEIPRWHPESTQYGGDPGDRFTLGADDVLRPSESTEPKLKLNRADRRRSGWRGRGLNLNGNGLNGAPASASH